MALLSRDLLRRTHSRASIATKLLRMGSREKTINQQVFESDVMASTPAFLKTDATGIDCCSFVVRQKTTGVGGSNNFLGLLAIQKMSWNLNPQLSVSK